MKNTNLEQIAKQIRADVLKMTTMAGSGHPSSCLSAADLMTGLMFGGSFRADLRHPKNPNNDRIIFSKGHAAPLLYALYASAGRIATRELLTLRRFGSRLEGHPMPVFPYTEVPTGSLGQGIAIGIGIALAARRIRANYFTYVLLGDGEMAEGSVWEAIQLAGFMKLDRLVGIIDVNRLGQTGPTMLGHQVDAYARRVSAFGWRTIVVDGHDVKSILTAYRQARRSTGKPTMIIAKTVKGKGASLMENKNGWHGRVLDKMQLKKALAEIGAPKKRINGEVAAPANKKIKLSPATATKKVDYQYGDHVSPRQALDRGLMRIAPKYPELMVLDGEVKNSTRTEKISDRYPKQFIECFISEQNMAGLAMGLASRGLKPVAVTFAAFLTRAHDQIRMAQYANRSIVFVGTHAGVSIGQDGPSQMGLDDLTMFRAFFNSTILYPADAVATEKLLELAVANKGISYLRITRGSMPVIYPNHTKFVIGGSYTWQESKTDRATIVAAGVTLLTARRAATILAKQKINVRVIDLYSIKPIDAATLRRAARQTKHLIVVEDHRPEGGIGEAVRTALGDLSSGVVSLAVRKITGSGQPERLLKQQGLDEATIVAVVKKVIKS